MLRQPHLYFFLAAALTTTAACKDKPSDDGAGGQAASGGGVATGGAAAAGGTAGAGGQPDPVCGNGKVEAGEECDDGNTTQGDNCENDCTKPGCENGIIDGGETCYDGLWAEHPVALSNFSFTLANDCDADGDLDIITVAYQDTTNTPLPEGQFTQLFALRNNGQAQLSPADDIWKTQHNAIPLRGVSLQPAAPGAPNLAILTENALLFVTGNGDCEWLNSPTIVPLPGAARDMVVAKLDDDGERNDVIITVEEFGDVKLYWYRSGDGYLGGPRYASGSQLSQLLATDIDEDGYDDVVYVDNVANKLQRHLRTNSTFDTNEPFPADPNALPDTIIALGAGDYDGDNDPDIVAASYDDSIVVSLDNQIDHSFKFQGKPTSTAGTEAQRGLHPYHLVMADFDGDNDADLLTSNDGDADNTPTLTLLISGGVGGSYYVATKSTFPLTMKGFPFALPARAKSTHWVDMNGDGALDLVVAWGNVVATMVARP